MDSKKLAKEIKTKILDDYYKKAYYEVFFQGGNSKLAKYYQNQLESYWVNGAHVTLELGSGEGEHFRFIKNSGTIEKYIALDLRPQPDSLKLESGFEWMQANAENIPLPSNSVDRIVATCLLLHLENPLALLLEIKRLLKQDGEFALLIPSDPGLLVRIGRVLLTRSKMKKAGISNPGLIYSLEHPNHIGGLLKLIKATFLDENFHRYEKEVAWKLRFIYRPFRIRSWNMNLFIVVHGQKI